MIHDCIQVFREEVARAKKNLQNIENKTELELETKLIIDSYVPKDGTYVLINIDKDFEIEAKEEICVDKKSGQVKFGSVKNYNYIRYLDYNSKLIEMNKPIDSKKVIHSNNFYSLAIKKENLLNGKFTAEVIDGYYTILENPLKKYTKPNAKELYLQIEQEIGTVDTGELQRIKEWVKYWQKDNSIIDIDITGKDYLKLFFVYSDEKYTKELYEKENRRYLMPNLFNSNDYNCKVNGEIVGLPSNNMGLNAKKPFLENRTRKVSAPYLVTIEEAILQGKFYDYLWSLASVGKTNVYFDFDREKIYAFSDKEEERSIDIDTGSYLRVRKGKVVEIIDCDEVVELNFNLKTPFYFKRIVEVAEDNAPYGQSNRREQLAAIIDEVFFSNMLRFNYFTEASDLSLADTALQHILLTYRGRLFEWFYRNPKCKMEQIIEEMAWQIIFNSMQKGYTKKTIQQLNLYWSLQDYFKQNNRMEEIMTSLQQSFKNHVDEYHEEWEFGAENVSADEEYYYAVGQMIAYFLSLTKAGKKPMSLANQFINAKKDELIKNKLEQLFKKYNYAMDFDMCVREKNILSHILLYKPVGEVNTQNIIAGFTASNAFYMKKDK